MPNTQFSMLHTACWDHKTCRAVQGIPVEPWAPRQGALGSVKRTQLFRLHAHLFFSRNRRFVLHDVYPDRCTGPCMLKVYSMFTCTRYIYYIRIFIYLLLSLHHWLLPRVSCWLLQAPVLPSTQLAVRTPERICMDSPIQ